MVMTGGVMSSADSGKTRGVEEETPSVEEKSADDVPLSQVPARFFKTPFSTKTQLISPVALSRTVNPSGADTSRFFVLISSAITFLTSIVPSSVILQFAEVM